MSLTPGGGPLSRPTPGTGGAPGQLDLALPASPAHLLFLHDAPLRVRGVLAGEVLVDTRRARLLHETGLLPQWCVPAADVRTDLLERTATRTRRPCTGEASYWTARVGGRVEEDLFRAYEDPHPETSGPDGLLAAPFGRLDAWYQEDEPLLAHPRDPYHRVDTRRSGAEVEVRLEGARAVAGHLCFAGDGVEVLVDGARAAS